MNNKTIDAALLRLMANAYPDTSRGVASHKADVVLLRSVIRGSPDDARRWRYLRERVRLKHLHTILDDGFLAPDRAYAAEIDAVLDRHNDRTNKGSIKPLLPSLEAE